MNIGLSKAFAATGNDHYKDMAVKNMDFLLTTFENEGDNGFFHTYKNGKAKYPAFLDDYAYLVLALIQLQEITGNINYLGKAMELLNMLLTILVKMKQGIFYFTHQQQSDVIVRKKEVYDGQHLPEIVLWPVVCIISRWCMTNPNLKKELKK